MKKTQTYLFTLMQSQTHKILFEIFPVGVDCVPRGHWAASGDTCVCHDWGAPGTEGVGSGGCSAPSSAEDGPTGRKLTQALAVPQGRPE